MRGENPTLRFSLPFPRQMVAKAKLVFAHADQILLRKSLEQMYWQENLLCIPLSRADTLQLPNDSRVQLQLEIETTGGDSLVAAPQWLYTGDLLDAEVLQ